MRKKKPRRYTPPPPEEEDDEEEYEDEDDWEEDDEEHDEDAEYYGYNCECVSCIEDRGAEAKAKKAKAKPKIVGRIARARNFVDTSLAELDDWIGEEKYSECNIANNTMDFSGPKKYFVHVQHERAGCFGGEGKFMNKSDIIKMLQNQLEPENYREVEDRIVIFDTQINKVIKPKIIL
jgi:hypothetical protein